jgi:hypothetical protein
MSQIIDKYNGEGFQFEQDIQGYLDYAHKTRVANQGVAGVNMRSFCIVPDIVAVDILTKYGLDIHDPEMDQQGFTKFKEIVKREYPRLLTNNIVKGKY